MAEQKSFTFIEPVGMPKPLGPYSYAIKVKPSASLILMSGVGPRDNEGTGIVGYTSFLGKSKMHQKPTGAYTQTMRIMERCQEILANAGATFDDVIKAEIWVTDINYWEQGVAEAFGKHFKQYPTVTVTAIEQLGLGLGHMVEIQLTAAV